MAYPSSPALGHGRDLCRQAMTSGSDLHLFLVCPLCFLPGDDAQGSLESHTLKAEDLPLVSGTLMPERSLWTALCARQELLLCLSR